MTELAFQQTAIPWIFIGASPDMMDWSFGNQAFPYAWRSSLAISVHEPDPPAAEEDPDGDVAGGTRRDPLCGQRIAFVKVTCSITGYQPSSGEESGTVVLGNERLEELERLTSEYLGCYGALLNVAFFPSDMHDRSGPPDDLRRMPRILDFTPKSREFLRGISETGEILTGSSRDLKIDESRTTTEKNETSVKVGARAGAGAGESGVSASAELSHTWGTTEEERRGLSAGSGDTRTQSERYTTTMDQLYSLLTGYHVGTNRGVALMLPRPGTLQPTNRRTFVQGLRMIEGVQDFIFVVSRPADMEGLCVEARLDTGHYPEAVPLTGDEVSEETAEFDFRLYRTFRGGGFLSSRGERIFFDQVFRLPSNERGAWLVDTEAPGTERGVRLLEDRSHVHVQGQPSARLSGVLTHERHTRIPVTLVPQPTAPDTVQAQMLASEVHAHGWDSSAGVPNRDTVVDMVFRVSARRAVERPAERTADPERLLVTRRTLAACYRSDNGCPEAMEISPFPSPPEMPWRETMLRDPDRARSGHQFDQIERTWSGLRAAMLDAGADGARGAEAHSFAETDFFARRVADRLPGVMIDRPLGAAVDLVQMGEGALLLANASVAQALSIPATELARVTGAPMETVRAVRLALLPALERSMKMPGLNGRPVLLPVTVPFGFDEDQPGPEASEALQAILKLLQEPNRHDRIEVRGHTDARGNPDYNQKLSVRRAEAVRDWLAAKGLDPQRMLVSGMGSNLPVSPEIYADGSDNPEARARNRRVDILVSR